MKTYLKRTWSNPKLISGKSNIHGDGVIANEAIVEGEKLMEFGGDAVSRREAFSGDYRSRSVWMINDDVFLALSKSDARPSLDEHLNHSCDANAWLVDEVNLVAKKSIPAGEEVTLDQGTWNFEDSGYTDNQEACSCGSRYCRHTLTENDWKLPEVQERYKGHFHPMIMKQIKG